MELSQATFQDFIAADGLSLVDFSATWCGPCRAMAPVVAALPGKIPGLRVGTIDVDKDPEDAAALGVRSIPFLALFRAGKLLATRVGATTPAALVAWIEEKAKDA